MSKNDFEKKVDVARLFNITHTLNLFLEKNLQQLNNHLDEEGIEGYFCFKSNEDGQGILFLTAFIGDKEYEITFNEKDALINFFLLTSIESKETYIRIHCF